MTDHIKKTYVRLFDFVARHRNMSLIISIACMGEGKMNELDIIELLDRFGEEVAFVVEDMINGTGERWEEGWQQKAKIKYSELKL